MATTTTELNQADGWVLVHTGGTNGIIQCTSLGGYVKIVFSTTAPASDADHHILQGGDYLDTIGGDDVYAASDFDGIKVTVST